ncbi:MAG: hypothetical protein JSS81_06005 [Acidobacteria bacterium]|nr:hypothetical protein [Acidobacteriota bacterium]
MKLAQILPHISKPDLPVRIIGTGTVTHVFIGKLVEPEGPAGDVVCLFAQEGQKASEDFEKSMRSIACQCGKQKYENFPFCGLCYSNLRTSVKIALRQNTGAELEQTYKLALRCLTVPRRSRRRK